MGDVDVEIEIGREGVKREGKGREREEKMGGQSSELYEVKSLALLLGFFQTEMK